MKTHSFDLHTVDDRLIDSWYRLNRIWMLENIPDEPVFSREDLLKQVLASLSSRDLTHLWIEGESGEMGAVGSLSMRKEENSAFPCFIRIFVHPRLRRRGIGTCLLRRLVHLAEEKKMKTARFITCSRCPAGERFLKKLGASVVETNRSNRLSLEEVDPNLLDSWMSLPEKNSSSFVIGEWRGDFPEEDLQELVDFFQAVHDADRGKPGFMEYKLTVDMLRSNSRTVAEGNVQTHTIYFRDRDSHKLLGMTEITWNQKRPEHISQGYTAVLPEARGQGLGRRLKAEMILNVRQMIPEARFIRSGNADHRNPILKINKKLGYKCTHYTTMWTAEIPPSAVLLQNHGSS